MSLEIVYIEKRNLQFLAVSNPFEKKSRHVNA